MRTMLAVVAAPLLVALFSCASPYAAEQTELRQNENRWASQAITDYVYTLRIGCF